MKTLNALHPSQEQIKAFLSHKKAGQPVFMLNLLKFKERASYKDDEGEDISGREAYGRYARAFSELVKSSGVDASAEFGGNINACLIGQAEGEWDAFAIFRYPNASVMFETVSSEGYRKIHKHRRAGLAGQLLISCDNEKVF